MKTIHGIAFLEVEGVMSTVTPSSALTIPLSFFGIHTLTLRLRLTGKQNFLVRNCTVICLRNDLNYTVIIL